VVRFPADRTTVMVRERASGLTLSIALFCHGRLLLSSPRACGDLLMARHVSGHDEAQAKHEQEKDTCKDRPEEWDR
jgi:hypothetical protein